MGPFLLLMLPALSFASITININSTEKHNRVVNIGKDSSIISDLEMQSYNLTDGFLKRAVKLYSKGTPIDVFVKSPTPWGDLYKSYQWTEVRRETIVKSLKTLRVTKEPVIIGTKLYMNYLNKEATFVTNLKKTVTTKVNNIFKGLKQSVGVKCNITLENAVPPLKHIDFMSHLRNNTEMRLVNTMQAKDDVTFDLKPQQSVEVFLNATKVIMEVLVEYETRLDGDVAVNYNPKYKGHHFWAYDVRDMLGAADKSSRQISVDVIVIEYYADAKMTLVDVATKSMMQTADAVLVEE